MVGGRQHILVAAGDALYAFALLRITVEREGFAGDEQWSATALAERKNHADTT